MCMVVDVCMGFKGAAVRLPKLEEREALGQTHRLQRILILKVDWRRLRKKDQNN